MNYIYLGDCHNVFKNEILDESSADDLKNFLANNRLKLQATSITFSAAQFKGKKTK